MTHRFFPKHRAGTEVLTLQLAQALVGRGHQVTILTGEPNESLPVATAPSLSADTYEGLTTYRLHYGKAEQTWRYQGVRGKLALGARLLTDGLDPVALHVDSPDRVVLVRDLVMRLKPDVAHINHLIGFSAAVIPAIRRLNIPVFFTPTDYFAVCPTDQLLHRFDNRVCEGPGDAVDCIRCLHSMPRWTARIAMTVAHTPLFRGSGALFRSLAARYPAIVGALNTCQRIMPSTRFLGSVLARHGVEKDRIRVVPYGIDIGELPPIVEVPDRFDCRSPLRIGFIGKLEAPKGPHVVLGALDHLGARVADVRLDIYAAINREDDYCNSLMTSAQKYGDSVRFAGTFPAEKIGAILRDMHVLVVPSIWYESIPLVLRSSLNAGVPVIVSEMGGLTEPLSGEMRKMSFTAGSSRELGALIQSLLDDPTRLNPLRRELAGQARSLADYVNDVEVEYRPRN